MKSELIYWQCSGCGETLQGIINRAGDFIADSELVKPAQFQACGRYLCGCPVGEPREALTTDEKDGHS